VFPEALFGRHEESCIKFPLDKLPESVKAFGLAGGLNLWIDSSDVVVSVPRGCVWEFLSSLVATSFAARSNVEEVGAFVCVAKSVDIEKGHAFERLFATMAAVRFTLGLQRHVEGEESLFLTLSFLVNHSRMRVVFEM
jgi:hypothetical protein